MCCCADDEGFPITDSVMGNFLQILRKTTMPLTDSVKTKASFPISIYWTAAEYMAKYLNVWYQFRLSKLRLLLIQSLKAKLSLLVHVPAIIRPNLQFSKDCTSWSLTPKHKTFAMHNHAPNKREKLGWGCYYWFKWLLEILSGTTLRLNFVLNNRYSRSAVYWVFYWL